MANVNWYNPSAAARVGGVVGQDTGSTVAPMRSWQQTPATNDYPSDASDRTRLDPTAGDPASRITMDQLPSKKLPAVVAAADKAKPNPDEPMTGAEADQMFRAKKGAQYSNLASLGFDEKQIVMMPHGTGRTNVSGLYAGDRDRTIVNMDAGASTAVHEATHRGIKMLRDQGNATLKELDNMYDEEIVTRAVMLRTFGNIEEREAGRPQSQVRQAADLLAGDKLFGRMVNELEQQAAYAIADRNMKRDGGVR